MKYQAVVGWPEACIGSSRARDEASRTMHTKGLDPRLPVPTLPLLGSRPLLPVAARVPRVAATTFLADRSGQRDVAARLAGQGDPEDLVAELGIGGEANGDRDHDALLDHPYQRAGSVGGVVAELGEPAASSG